MDSLANIQRFPIPPKPPKPPKSQEELRSILRKRLLGMKPTLEAAMEEYRKALDKGTFEDQKGEEEGTGEKRKEAMEKNITNLFERAENIRNKLDSGEELPQINSILSTHFTFKNPQGKVTYQEDIELNLEAKITEFTSFYTSLNIPLPPNFGDSMRDIWQRHETEIQQAMENHGFNDMLLVPPNIPLPVIAEKMKMQNGYLHYQIKEDFSDIISQNTNLPRIILYHHFNSLPEIAQNTDLDIHLDITAKGAEALYQANPTHFFSTLEDFLILERKHYQDKNGVHLSSYATKSANWLPGSKCGSRLVNACWDPDFGGLMVPSGGPGDRSPYLGWCPPLPLFLLKKVACILIFLIYF